MVNDEETTDRHHDSFHTFPSHILGVFARYGK